MLSTHAQPCSNHTHPPADQAADCFHDELCSCGCNPPTQLERAMRTSLVDRRRAVFPARTGRPARNPCLLCGCSTVVRDGTVQRDGTVNEPDEPICWCDSCRDHGCVPDLDPAPGHYDRGRGRAAVLPYEPRSLPPPDAANLAPVTDPSVCSEPDCWGIVETLVGIGVGPRCPAHASPEDAMYPGGDRLHHPSPLDGADAVVTAEAEVEDRMAWAGLGHSLASRRASSPPLETCPICAESPPLRPPSSRRESAVSPAWQLVPWLVPSVAPSGAEQWANKQWCLGDHRFCRGCLAGWIAASLDSGHGLIRCPAEGCAAKMLPDDVERISPEHRERALELLGRNFEARAAEIAADPELHTLLRSIAQQCPRCKLWIQKSDACNDMLCLCGASFCYSCGQEPCGCYSYGSGGPPVDYDSDDYYRWDRGVSYDRYDPVHNPHPWVTDGSCVDCGCSREFDSDGERVCHCDTCLEDGCHPSRDHGDSAYPHETRPDYWARFAEECRTRPYHPELNPRPPVYTGCLECGCSSEFCPSTGDRICGCDSCRETGCVEHADPPLPPPHVGCAVCGCSQEVDPVSSERVCHCDACHERGCSVQLGPHEDGVMEPSEAWFRAADHGLAYGACTPTCRLAHDHRHWRSHLDDGCRRCGCSQEIDAASGERVCHCDACVETGCLGVTGAQAAWDAAAANGLARWYDPVSGDRLCVYSAMVPHEGGETGDAWPVPDPFHTSCCSRGCVDIDFAPALVSRQRRQQRVRLGLPGVPPPSPRWGSGPVRGCICGHGAHRGMDPTAPWATALEQCQCVLLFYDQGLRDDVQRNIGQLVPSLVYGWDVETEASYVRGSHSVPGLMHGDLYLPTACSALFGGQQASSGR